MDRNSGWGTRPAGIRGSVSRAIDPSEHLSRYGTGNVVIRSIALQPVLSERR